MTWRSLDTELALGQRVNPDHARQPLHWFLGVCFYKDFLCLWDQGRVDSPEKPVNECWLSRGASGCCWLL